MVFFRAPHPLRAPPVFYADIVGIYGRCCSARWQRLNNGGIPSEVLHGQSQVTGTKVCEDKRLLRRQRNSFLSSWFPKSRNGTNLHIVFRIPSQHPLRHPSFSFSMATLITPIGLFRDGAARSSLQQQLTAQQAVLELCQP